MPLVQTRGAASAQGFGEFAQAASGAVNYIEDVFSTWLYTGTSATQTITNNIDLSTKGGMVWSKSRSAATANTLYDTVRGATFEIQSNATSGQTTETNGLNQFNTNGYRVGAANSINNSGATYVSWTFREQPKFFDVVTYTGNGTAGRTVAHNLGSVPGCIIVKNTSASGDYWNVYHRSLGATKALFLNDTQAAGTYTNVWNDTAPTSTVFSLGTSGETNRNGNTFVAYLFAHDAGGFGLTGTDNVISCGSFTTDGSGNATVDLGYEPQWVLRKSSSNAGYPWYIMDNMRGYSTPSGSTSYLSPNDATAEVSYVNLDGITSTGFKVIGQAAGVAFIYIAIRRGPMKVPTTGTSVFAPVTGNFTSPYTVTTNFPVDLTISSRTAGATRAVNDRLRGGTTNSYVYLNTATDDAESTGTGAGLGFQSNTAVIDTNWQTGGNALWWNFRRAPSFFDEVCYSGTGSVTNVSHNLQAVPELMIVKSRSAANFWRVYSSAIGNTKILILSTDDAPLTSTTTWNSTTPTSSVFTLGTDGQANGSGQNFVNYLFATCAGVSKVGSYTGTGATQTIDCGFGAGGARFALIKRTDSTGDWWVWDSARGMVSGTDPRIDLNAGNSQTNANWVYTISTGFQIVTTDASVNASGGTYIFLAIA